MNDYTAILFARPSFIEGFSRALDLGDTLTEYNTSLSGEQADARAIAADWKAVGDDIRETMAKFAAEHNLESQAAGVER